jgi:hypothetical protein
MRAGLTWSRFGRFDAFKIGRPYAGRLLAAVERPIENENRAIALLRLEFEIFARDDPRRQLASLGQIASRDLVLGPDAASDGGVVAFAAALGVSDARRPAAWSQRAAESAWVEIVFGPADVRDGRNRFAEIRGLSPDGYRVTEYPHELSSHWVTPDVAADALDFSATTIRRRTKEHLAEWGEALERRTAGRHRRINLLLLRHLLQDPGWLDVAQILSARDGR